MKDVAWKLWDPAAETRHFVVGAGYGCLPFYGDPLPNSPENDGGPCAGS